MSALDGTLGALSGARQSLQLSWGALAQVWRDEVKERFEQEMWVQIDQMTETALRQLEELIRAVREAERMSA